MARKSAEEMIYFIQATDGTGPIKIGYTSDNPQVRLAALQTGSHIELKIFATIEGDRGLEDRLKRYFAYCRIRGEWFTPTPDLVKVAKGEADLPESLPCSRRRSDALCKGVVVSGYMAEPCRYFSLMGSEFCFHHQRQAIEGIPDIASFKRCGYTRGQGYRCYNKARAGFATCGNHKIYEDSIAAGLPPAINQSKRPA